MSTTRALEPALCSYLGTTQSFYTFNTIWRRWWKFHDVAVWRSNFRHFATFQSTVLSRLGNYLYRIVYWVSTVTYIIFCTRPFLSEKFHVAYFLLAAKFFFFGRFAKREQVYFSRRWYLPSLSSTSTSKEDVNAFKTKILIKYFLEPERKAFS